MAVKVLGQVNPAAATLITLYTVPAGMVAVASTLAVCNMSAAPITYRVAVRPGGAPIANAHYIAFNATLPPNSSDFLTLGLTLAAGDVVSVLASDINAAFSLFGDEN